MVSFLPSTRPELLERIQDSVRMPSADWGSEQHRAWTDLADRYRPGLFSYCRTKRLSASDTDEVVQDTLWKVRRSLHGFQHGGARGQFRGWLLSVLKSAMQELGRRKRRRQREAQPPSTLLRRRIDRRARSPHEELMSRRQIEALFRALTIFRDTAKAEDFRLLEAVKLEDHTVPEAAAELGLSDQAAYSRLRRLLKELQAIFARELER